MKSLLPTLILTIALLSANAQPHTFLGSSYSFVDNYMSNQSAWYLSKSSKKELHYKNTDSNIEVTYHFLRDTPSGATRTCNQCTVKLPDSAAADLYIDQRITSVYIKEGHIAWIASDDLSDYPIYIIRFGNNIIYKY